MTRKLCKHGNVPSRCHDCNCDWCGYRSPTTEAIRIALKRNKEMQDAFNNLILHYESMLLGYEMGGEKK